MRSLVVLAQLLMLSACAPGIGEDPVRKTETSGETIVIRTSDRTICNPSKQEDLVATMLTAPLAYASDANAKLEPMTTAASTGRADEDDPPKQARRGVCWPGYQQWFTHNGVKRWRCRR